MTDVTVWSDVDRYFDLSLLGTDPILDAALADAEAAGLPAIQVAPNQGKLLMMLGQLVGAKRILEVGTLGGYSTIWLARALAPGAALTTLELDPKHAAVARKNLERAGFAHVEVRVGRAIDSLPEIARAGGAPFDLAFIDADKPSNVDYFVWAHRMARVGSVIVVDNVVRGGAVVDAASTDASVLGVRRLVEHVARETAAGRIDATALQTVGSKGWDGVLVARVLALPEVTPSR